MFFLQVYTIYDETELESIEGDFIDMLRYHNILPAELDRYL